MKDVVQDFYQPCRQPAPAVARRSIKGSPALINDAAAMITGLGIGAPDGKVEQHARQRGGIRTAP